MRLNLKMAGAAVCLACLAQPGMASDAQVTVKQLKATEVDGKSFTQMPADFTSPTIDRLSKAPAGFIEVPVYYSADKKLETAVKHYQKMTLRLKNWPIDEFMQFLEGEVEITDAQGKATRYRAGDSIMIPKGFNGEWKQLSDIKMITVIYTPGG